MLSLPKSRRSPSLLAVFLAAVLSPGARAASMPAGWACTGACGTLAADGVVSTAPSASGTYQYVTTDGGLAGVGALPGGRLGSESNGSTLTTGVFTVGAGASLDFSFNYVTSDGSGYTDYAWAELFSGSGVPVSLLFTARTESSGTVVPGTGMPAPAATLSPGAVPILAGATTWSPLGSSSGQCYAAGCGDTGWIASSYTIQQAGSYYLQFGVVNWGDESYNSGLAIDGVVADGIPISPASPVPEPSAFFLIGTGLVSGVGGLRRRFR